MANPRCLVTGGTGFIGYNLIRELKNQEYDILVSGKNDENIDGIEDKIVGFDLFSLDWQRIGKLDFLFHQAAIVDTTISDREEMYRVNSRASRFLFEKAREYGCKNIVYASSTATYGNEPAPYIEGVTRQVPLNAYAESKKLMEQEAMEFAEKNKDTTIVGLRYCNVYGNYDKHKGKMRCYIMQMIDQMKTGDPKLFFDGQQRRDFIYVKDVVRANILAAKSQESCIVNCGSGRAVSFNESLRILNNLLGLNRKPLYMKNPFGSRYQNFTQCDMTQAREKIGFQPEYSLEQGLEDMLHSI